MNIIKIVPLLLFIFASALGQGEFSLYNLNRSVPQAHQLNPAFYPEGKVFFGLPVLSSSHISIDMDQLSFDHVFAITEGQALKVDFDNISNKLRDNNHFSINSDVQLFFFGFHLNNNFYSLAINDRISSNLVYSKDFVNMAIYGNGDSRILGRNISFNKMLLNQNLYHEVALGMAKKINENISIGGRVKILFGVLNSQTGQMNGYIRTDNDSIYLSASNIVFRNSGYKYFSDYENFLSIYQRPLPLIYENNGLGIDLGTQYQLTDRINISASVTDVGYIKWNNNTQSYRFNDITYNFEGFDLNAIIDEETHENILENELDSLEAIFTSEELKGISYKSSLTSNFYTGFDYQLAKLHHVGAQLYGKIINGSITPEFGIYYNIKVRHILNAVVNASFRNGKIHAAGIGASLDLGVVQLYGTSESVTALIKPEAAYYLDARFGINLIFGKQTKTKEERKLDRKALKIPLKKEKKIRSLKQWRKANLRKQFQQKVKLKPERKKRH